MIRIALVATLAILLGCTDLEPERDHSTDEVGTVDGVDVASSDLTPERDHSTDEVGTVDGVDVASSDLTPERDYSTDEVRTIDDIIVVGDDLTSEDIAAIREAIAKSDLDPELRILSIRQEGPTRVLVTSGEHDFGIFLKGIGESINLDKVDGKWIVDERSIAVWMS